MDFRRVKYIAIDEFAVNKGHQYMTVVMDLETKRALYVKKGKDGASLREFWKEIKK
ncbi:MAG: transposase [Saprospiraceae bacterium]|nr:transposase [Saprospiraceae bacterium]